MIQFKYDNIEADKLILEFRCKECHSLTKTKLLSVPKMDYNTFKDVSCSYKHKCQCGACYTIELFNGLDDSFGFVHRIFGKEVDVLVHEVPDIPYNKESVFVDTINAYSRIESIVNGVENLSKEDKKYIYCLLFSNLISILDSFIKIYTEPMVLGNDDLIEKFSVAFGMPKGNTEEKAEKIKNFYERKSFQSVVNQKKLLEDVFNVKLEIDDIIVKYVAIRDIIIHRNAIDIEGYIYNIKKSLLLQALGVIKMYIRQINNALFDFEINSYIEKIMNR